MDVSGPVHYTDWEWVLTNLGIPVGMLDRRGVCCVRFLVGKNAHSRIAWPSQSLSVPTGNSATSLKTNNPVFGAYCSLRLSRRVESHIKRLFLLVRASRLFTTILRSLVQMIDRRCLEAVHLDPQSGISDDVSLLPYLFLQEYIIPSMYRQKR